MIESLSKTRGRIAELTHLVPIRRGTVPEPLWGGDWVKGYGVATLPPTSYALRLGTILRAFDDREAAGFPSVIRLFRQIHFAKWALLDGGTRLLLSVVFDGDWGDYMRALARDVPAMLHLIWSNTAGWDLEFCERSPAERAERLMLFIRAHQLEVSFLYAHHPQFTVRDIDVLAREGGPLSEHEQTRTLMKEMGSTEQRRARVLAEYGASHSLRDAQQRFTAVLAPRYDALSFQRAYRETFGTESDLAGGASR